MDTNANTELNVDFCEVGQDELAHIAGGMQAGYDDGDSKANRSKASTWESLKNDPDHTFATAGL